MYSAPAIFLVIGGLVVLYLLLTILSKASARPASGAPNLPADSTVSKLQSAHPQGASRETCESIAFAFVLALLFRSFVAEAFVIPTGSMAPTLYGRNKDVVCPECQLNYAIGASDELDDET